MKPDATLPWLKWYPRQWRSEPTLKLVGLSGRGLVIEMINLMHEADPYGHLLIAGRAPTAAEIANNIGGVTAREVARLMAVLDAANVFSKTDRGVIYSRHMVRARAKELADKANGRTGGNPKLKGEGLTPPRLKGVNPKSQKAEAGKPTKGLPASPRERAGARETPAPLAAATWDVRRCAPADFAAVWSKVAEAFRAEGGETTFARWFGPLKVLKCDASKVVIACPSDFARDTIVQRHGGRIVALIRENSPAVDAVEFVGPQQIGGAAE